MAWSLEASLIVPLSATLLVAGIRLAEPIYDLGRTSARLGVVAVIASSENGHLYQVYENRIGRRNALSLAVSPGKMLQMARLLRDDLEIIWRLLPQPES